MHTLRRGLLAVVGAALLPASAPAGLYYSGETYAELPSQWRGFLLDHRALRMVAVPRPETGPTLLRQSYLAEAERLGKKADAGTLTADEAADLGAVYVRLGQAEKAVELLRAAQRRHPEHFRIASNLGTAWQVLGDLDQAEAALRAALPLAPKELRGAEEYHLKLVQLRKRGGKEDGGPDDLFGVRYAGPQGEPAAGSIDAEQMKKLPADAVATAQRLALWLPADGRLLWQLGELANAYGDVRTAANILEGCVSEFGMSDPELRRRRQVYRAAADKLPAAAAGPGAPAAPEHERHRGRLRTRSARPLVTKLDTARLPP
ncbi:MAG TPA: tetratricopeptide repeat protein, partial [Gemmataceae bacterium]